MAAAHQKEPLEKVIARMCAKARIPMLTIATSEDIQRGFESQNYKNIPTSHTTVASFVSQYAGKVMEGHQT